MDFNSRCKKMGYSYTAPIVTTPMPTLLEMKREAANAIYGTRKVKVHDCRDEKLVDFRDKHLWEAWLLSHGVRQTSEDVRALYTSPQEEELKNQQGYKMDRPQRVDKLMFTVGCRGPLNGQFEFPRGLTVDDEGNIFVADTKNHRIQVFNQCGIYKRKMGTKGTGEGEFDSPTGVAVLPNDDIAVAEQKNKRVQIFDPTFKFKLQFPTENEPISMACDREFNIVLATSSHTIEVYRRLGKLLHKFSLPTPEVSGKAKGKATRGIVYIALNNKDEVIVSDPASSSVTFYKYDGAPLYRFTPPAASSGLGFIPAGVGVDALGELVIADALNHVINVYSERGVLKRHHAGPMDNVGAVQALALGSDGHLVGIECTNNGPHCVKIFRYLDCVCHQDRPGSSLRRTPVPIDMD